MNKSLQNGAALIYVLIVLLVITVIGTIAIRQGVLSLKIVSNSQIQAMLSQSTNATLYRIQSPDFLNGYITSAGLLGFVRAPQNFDKEVVFCFKNSQSDFFDINTASVIYLPDGTTTINNSMFGVKGFCNPSATESSFFTSNRKIIMTQVTVKQLNTDESDAPLSNILIGSDVPGGKADTSSAFKVFVVSLMPTVSDASNEDIFECLSTKMSEPPEGADQTTVTDCLSDLNVPYNTQSVSYKYAPSFT